MIVMVLVGGLLLREPDFGAFVVITSIAIGILFLGGMNWRLFAVLIVGLFTCFVLMVALSPYRLQRVIGFMDPWADPFGKGYQLSCPHSLWTRWIFRCRTKYKVLKIILFTWSTHGLFISSCRWRIRFCRCMCMYQFICMASISCFAIGRQAASLNFQFAALVAQGIGIWLGVQSLINMGVNVGLLPTKGLTLLFMSFGGSGVLANCVGVAVLLRIDWEKIVHFYAANENNYWRFVKSKWVKHYWWWPGYRWPCVSAIAVAEYFARTRVAYCMVRDTSGMEAKLVPQHNFPLEQLDFVWGVMVYAAGVVGFWVANHAKHGYLSSPSSRCCLGDGWIYGVKRGLAARLCHTPLVIHEQKTPSPGWLTKYWWLT